MIGIYIQNLITQMTVLVFNFNKNILFFNSAELALSQVSFLRML